MGEDKLLPYYFYGGDKVTFQELINLTKVYTRDTDSRIFTDADIKMFINQGIDRIRQYNVFESMEYLSNPSDTPKLLPSMYHYILALFAASRLFDTDERFYEGTDKRNEFEEVFANIVERIENGTLTITDENGFAVDNTMSATDHVADVYFKGVIAE